MNKAYLIIGTNIGDRIENMNRAIRLLKQYAGPVLQASSVYETEPWGISEQPAFYNQVVLLQTGLNKRQLLHTVLKIENDMGRTRSEKYGARIIDIDILFFNEETEHSADLTIPHPRITERKFVLAPLAEIAADFVHPEVNQTINALLQQSDDPLKVRKL